MDDEQKSVLAFRLSQVEKTLETQINQINIKLDQLISLQNENQTRSALEEAARKVLTERVTKVEVQIARELHELDKKMNDLQKQSTDLKITNAERFGPGAIAGIITSAIVSAAALIAKFVFGV